MAFNHRIGVQFPATLLVRDSVNSIVGYMITIPENTIRYYHNQGYTQKETASKLGINRKTLRRLSSDYGISWKVVANPKPEHACENPECYVLTTNPKYCSRSCSVAVSNASRLTNSTTCLWCGGDLERYELTYCSRTCFQSHQRSIRIQDWLSGKWDGSKASGEMSTTIRTFILEQSNYSCMLCGWNEISPTLGYPPVQIDHIDGNWTNHAPNNVRVLCPNCHSLTETFGAQNKESPGNRAVGSKKHKPISANG